MNPSQRRRARHGQAGVTLIETLLVLAITTMVMVPLFGWGLFAAREQADTRLRNTDGSSIGLFRTAFIKDVASATRGDVGTAANGTDCSGGRGAASAPTETKLRLRTTGSKSIVYNEAASSKGSGTSLWRRECDGATLLSSVEAVRRVSSGTVVTSCTARTGAPSTDCGRISLRLLTERSEMISMTASIRAGEAIGSSSGPVYVSPDVVVSVAPIDVYRGETVTFTGSGTTDPGGSALTYRWEYGDGSAAATTADATHSYGQLGEFTAVFTATNTAGTPSSDFVRIKVRNRLPTATMSKPAADVSTYRCTDVTYEAVGSNDSGDSSYSGSVVSYDWTYGDGGTSTKTSNAAHTRQYTTLSPDAGATAFPVSLKVTDNDGGVSTAVTRGIKVVNRAPSAVTIKGNGSTGPISGSTPLVVNFTSNASDPDGTCDTLSYLWEFSDGTTSTEASPSKTFNSGAASRTAKLTVKDGSNASVVSNTVTITLNTPPVAAFTASPTSVRAGVNVSMTNQSTDAETATASLGYAWTFPNGSPATSTGANPGNVKFGANVAAGQVFTSATYQLALTVTDASGSTNSTTRQITVTGAPAPSNFRRTGGGSSGGSRYIDFAWNADSSSDLFQIQLSCNWFLCSDNQTKNFTGSTARFDGLSSSIFRTNYNALIRARDTYTQTWGPWTSAAIVVAS